MRSIVRVSNLIVTLIVLIALSAVGKASARNSLNAPIAPNIDVSQRPGNESEEAIAVNPTNPNNIVIFTNIAEGVSGMFLATSFDGGLTWTRRIVGEGNDVFGDTCCDPSLSFDEFGNLFMTYLYNTENVVPVALSTDGGLTFSVIANIDAPPKAPGKKTPGDSRGLFRFVDQPTITAGNGEVWVTFNAGGPIFATGAPVSGLGQVGAFIPGEVAPGTNNCTYGDIAIGPDGQVMQVCNLTESGQGGGKVFVNLDPDGLGPAGFGDRIFVTATHIGGFDFIPPQPDRSVDAESGLAWDRSGGPHNGRVYLVYTKEEKNESDDTNVYVRYSDDNGSTWSAGVRVNDDNTANSQFMPKISLDQTTGNIAVTWYDSRADLGAGGSGDTDGLPNTDAQFWGSFSANGTAFTPNFQISAGTSNSQVSGNGIDYGDYDGLSFYGGVAHPSWSDNSNSTGNNPDGALSKLDIYTAAIPFIH
ncbi:MAG TPA: sialidase family protein [Anaerolineales bacterium]|nr:sialidase family protein [Anaerolineales bacterium]HLO30139.1 sialidase family protein [Anaerolineales bacterium]